MAPIAGAPEPIAIVGIGCRLPGGADGPATLWRLLLDRFDGIGRVPANRFDVDDLYDPRPATPGRVMSEYGGFLSDIEDFDADFFHIAGREAERLDPQQRLLLETAWEALEDAGVPSERVAGSNTGVFVGMWTNEFESRMFADEGGIDFHMTTGTGRYAASGRLSYFLDALGPSITIDTACSSSLVAVHLACQALRGGESDLALAGGSNLILAPSITIAYSQLRMMAPDGHCKFGDASADGYVRSEGVGIIALKRLSDALADGDRVYAVIRGSSVTNDGSSSGLLARPGQAGQEEMLRLAYARAAVDPSTVQYVEAHGTGTAAGDPVELAALGAVVGVGRPADAPCLVGSIKTNIGHAEGAAGIAGIIKLALALHHGEIPPSLHLAEPNPKVPFASLGLRVCGDRTLFDTDRGPVLAGVTAFGIAGTNAHAVLESVPSPAGAVPVDDASSLLALPISARSEGALRALAGHYADLVESGAVSGPALCAAAATRRSHLEHRIVVVGEDAAGLGAALRAHAGGDEHPAVVHGVVDPERPKVAFVFAGQGSQWVGMGRELLVSDAVFRRAMERCDAAVATATGWSPLAVLAEDDPARLDRIDVIQPLLFAIQVALAERWRSWGVQPDAVIGHSMGEVAAAHVAGALTLEQAARVIATRSRLLHRISGEGAMAVVDLPWVEAQAAIGGHEHELSIAASNSPRSTVISGAPSAVDAVLADLQARDVFCRLVKVDVASHSPQVEPLLDDLRSELADLVPTATAVVFHSTVDASALAGDALGPDYWARNLRRPVRFSETVAALTASGPTVFVELGPHPILLPAIEQAAGLTGAGATTVGTLRRGEPERASMLAALGHLHVAGVRVDWDAVVGGRPGHVDLPLYPWQRERYWYEPTRTRSAGRSGHPLLGGGVRPASEPGTVHWHTTIDHDRLGFLAGHVVGGEAIMPAAGFVEIIRAAALDAFGESAPADLDVVDLEVIEALPLDPRRERDLQVTFDEDRPGGGRLRIHSSDAAGAGAGTPTWRLHATATLAVADGPSPTVELAAVRARCPEHRDADAHLAAMRGRGLEYDGAFRTVEETWHGDGELVGRLSAPDAHADAMQTRIGLVDGCLQLAVALVDDAPGETYFPVSIDRVSPLTVPLDPTETWVHVEVIGTDPRSMRCEITVLDAGGSSIGTLAGVELRRMGGSRRLDDLFFDVAWRSSDRDVAPESGPQRWIVYTDGAVGDEVVERLRSAGDDCTTISPGAAFRRVDEHHVELDPVSMDDHRGALADLAGAAGAPCAGVVYAWAAEIGQDAADPVADASVASEALIALAQGWAAHFDDAPVAEPRLWLVTCGAQLVGSDDEVEPAPAQSVVWGLGRVLAAERPSCRSTLVDVAPGPGSGARLVEELRAGSDDRQLVLRGTARLAPRLARLAVERPAALRRVETDEYQLAIAEPGTLDSLRPRTTPRRAPGPHEVEVRIDAAGLNFLDVLKAMGVCPGVEPSPDVALGAEGAGVVVATGSAVDGVSVGDEVVVVTPAYHRTPLLARHATVPAAFVAPRPAHLTPEEAATLPVAYLTVYYGLVELARLRAGERVLIHAATGGVGLAAIELCRHIGAEIYATAGTPAKREHLRAAGIDHVYDSRTLDFAHEVLADTGGRGVDVVLNSLVGAAIPAGLSTLAPRGRFIEIGKRDVYADTRLGMAALKHNIAVHVLDLAGLTEDDPDDVAEVFRRVIAMVADLQLAALPVTAAPITDAADTFRLMARAAHLGKLVLTMPATVAADVGVVRSDATYVITGGLGALGLAVAGRLADRGARQLVLVGRSAPSDAAAGTIAAMRASGVTVEVVQADVTDGAGLAAALDRVRGELPPIRGVVHAAGTLADATIGRMDAEQLHRALDPKLAGGWNLHRATLADPLDFFVGFSSVAAVLGLTGQANYAAGNAFLDALAETRRRAGLPALSIDWGPWAEVGLAAADDIRGGRLEQLGLGGLTTDEGLDALERLIDSDLTRAVTMRFDARRWDAATGSSGLLDELVDSQPATTHRSSLRERMLEVPAGPRRRAALEEAIRGELAHVLRIAADRIDRNRPLEALGLDSLMALELRNRLESETEIKLSATLAFNHPTVAALAAHLADRMELPLDAELRPSDDPSDVSSDGSTDGAAVDDGDTGAEAASDADVESMLADELAEVQRLLESDTRWS